MSHSTELLKFTRQSPEELIRRSATFRELLSSRRTVRSFSDEAVPQAVIRNAVACAHSAPSGANMQPWHFVAVRDSATKVKIREAAEQEERELYAHRATDEWLQALAPLGTDAHKPFLEHAPWLIAVFAEKYSFHDDGSKRKHYYTPESVGIATGMLITALHHAGLATLTHTPSPMGFLTKVLNRPANERPFLLLVVGYPSTDATVPLIVKRPLDDVLTIVDQAVAQSDRHR